jgi:hypothetical protein
VICSPGRTGRSPSGRPQPDLPHAAGPPLPPELPGGLRKIWPGRTGQNASGRN